MDVISIIRNKYTNCSLLQLELNMLNKPIILSLMLSLIYFFIGCVFLSAKNGLYSYLLSIIVLFVASLYIGISYAKKFKVEMSKLNKIKIALYYSIFWIIFIFSIVILMVMNTTVKDLPLFNLDYSQGILLLKIFLGVLFYFSINGLFIYFALGLGCKLKLIKRTKESESEQHIIET